MCKVTLDRHISDRDASASEIIQSSVSMLDLSLSSHENALVPAYISLSKATWGTAGVTLSVCVWDHNVG